VTRAPRPTIERIWFVYLLCVSAVALLVPASGAEGHDVTAFLIIQAIVALGVCACVLLLRRGEARARLPRAALAIVGLPVVFSSLCYLLPHVHPEAYEFTWLAIDRAIFGGDIARITSGMPNWCVELLQLTYASFYPLCIAAAGLAWWGSGARAFDRAMLLMVGGFLCSYLGYLLLPTIGPKVVLDDVASPQGVWLTASLRAWIDAAEASHWDCFPSGHTMMTTTALIVLWRWCRRAFWWLLVPALLLIASTMLLHYHWSADVAAGALLAWPCARLCDWLAFRDDWPAVQASTK